MWSYSQSSLAETFMYEFKTKGFHFLLEYRKSESLFSPLVRNDFFIAVVIITIIIHLLLPIFLFLLFSSSVLPFLLRNALLFLVYMFCSSFPLFFFL